MSTYKYGLSENIIGSALRRARKELHLTQAEFAEPLSISGSYVSDIEKGKAIPSEAVIREIIAKYRINRDWLMHGEGDMFSPVVEESQLEFGEMPEPLRKMIALFRTHPDKAWEFYAAALERAELTDKKKDEK